MHIKEILLQIFIALTPYILYNLYYRDKAVNYSQKFIIITCSLSLFLAMTFPLSIEDGIIFDVRYVILFFGQLFGGMTTGLILLTEFLIYRLYIGGAGTLAAMLNMAVLFPLTLLLCHIYRKSNFKHIVTLIAGLSYSVVPICNLYLVNADYALENVMFNSLVIPTQNSIGIWLLISLINKSVADKELQLNYIQNEKIEAMNHVAASLAHEVRNPLTAIMGFLKLIRENTVSKEKLEQFIDISIDEIKRTESILSEYLSMSKPLNQSRQATDLYKQLQSVIDVMTPYANMNNVSLDIKGPVQPILISANPSEIKQILVNFIKNAIEACSDLSKGKVAISFRVESDTVKLKIVDNGVGMNKEQLQRLGSIYYSTKNTGTGLGLTHSYQIIRSMNGVVSVHSEPQEGTEFTISLPLLQQST